MTLGPDQLKAIAAEWRSARSLHQVYKGIAEQFELAAPACLELECPVDSPDPETRAAVRAWLDTMDKLIGVHQLRLFLQTSPLSTETNLRNLVEHYLGHEGHTESDRDKLDFLLVQYFSECTPAAPRNALPQLGDVARVLQGPLGQSVMAVPDKLKGVYEVLARMDGCRSLRELLEKGILQECRRLKVGAGADYFEPASLVVFAWFNCRVRQTFFRLMHADVTAIREGVKQLRRRGVRTLDCRHAGLSDEEPLERVVELCRHWKKPFRAEYSAGNPFTQLMELRTAVDEAVKQATKANLQPEPVAHTTPAAKTGAPVVPGIAGVGAAPKKAPAAAPVSAPPPQKAPAAAQAAPPPAAVPPKAPVAAASPAPQPGELQKIIAQLTQYLASKGGGDRSEAVSVMLGGARLPLSAFEVAAFVHPGDFSEVVQRAVAMRVLLVQAFDKFRRDGLTDGVHAIIPTAKTIARELQAAQDESRSDHDVESTAAISGAAQRLWEVIEDVEKLSATSTGSEQKGIQ
ncbi:MAG: hypothetical protein ACE14L_07175 [Terriglobales bacterium]